MITTLSHACVYVLDQDSAKAFYTDKLGMTVVMDFDMGDGIRWLTVAPAGRPDLELILADCRMGHDADSADQIRALVAKGALGPGVLATDDCHATFAELSARGVQFLQEPADRPYAIEAIFRDDSGNWFSLSESKPFDADAMAAMVGGGAASE